MLRRCASLCTFVMVLSMASIALAGQVAGVGKPAPDFTLTAQSGDSYTLSGYQGKVVLLMMIGYN